MSKIPAYINVVECCVLGSGLYDTYRC